MHNIENDCDEWKFFVKISSFSIYDWCMCYFKVLSMSTDNYLRVGQLPYEFHLNSKLSPNKTAEKLFHEAKQGYFDLI